MACCLHDVELVTLVNRLLFETLGGSDMCVCEHIIHMYVYMCSMFDVCACIYHCA